MGAKSNALENAIIDWWLRGQALNPPATTYIKLITCDGPRIDSAVVTLGQLIVVQCDDAVWRLYKVTTAGTLAAAQPSYPGVAGEVITDNTAQLTEQNAGLEDGTEISHPVGGNYAHASVASSLVNWAGTQGAGTTTASSGTNATTSNNNAIAFNDPTADWGWIFGFVIDDTSGSLGNYMWSELNGGPVQIVNGAQNIQFAAGALTYQEDN